MSRGIFAPWAVLGLADGTRFVVTFDLEADRGSTKPEWDAGLLGSWFHEDDGTWVRDDGVVAASAEACDHGMYDTVTGAWEPVPAERLHCGLGKPVVASRPGWSPCFPFTTVDGQWWLDARLG